MSTHYHPERLFVVKAQVMVEVVTYVQAATREQAEREACLQMVFVPKHGPGTAQRLSESMRMWQVVDTAPGLDQPVNVRSTCL